MSGSCFQRCPGGFVPHLDPIIPLEVNHLLRPKCDRYGCLIPPVPRESALRGRRPITKMGYDACKMPMILRQRCPCCNYRDVPDMCCRRISKYPNLCRYAEKDLHHKRLYGEYIYRFDGVCRY